MRQREWQFECSQRGSSYGMSDKWLVQGASAPTSTRPLLQNRSVVLPARLTFCVAVRCRVFRGRGGGRNEVGILWLI